MRENALDIKGIFILCSFCLKSFCFGKVTETYEETRACLVKQSLKLSRQNVRRHDSTLFRKTPQYEIAFTSFQ
jgi:hypothetical protein